MKNKKHILYLILFLFATKLSAQEAPIVLSMKQAIDYANGNNSNLKISRLDEQVARKQTEEIRARGLPQANINGSFEDRFKVPRIVFGDSAIPMGQKYNTSLQGEVTQMVYDPSFWVGLRAAKASTKLYSQTTQQVTEQTALTISKAYYSSIVAEKSLELLRSNLSTTERLLATTELQFKNGVAKRVDVNRLKVNVSNLKSQIQQAEVGLSQAYNALKIHIGLPINQNIILSDTILAYDESEAKIEESSEEFTIKRIDYAITQTRLELQHLDMKNNASGYYPTLTAYANYGYSGQGAELGLFKTHYNNWIDYTTSSIGLRLRIPVFDGFQKSARIQQSKIKSEQIREQLRLTKSNIDMEVSNATNLYRSTLQRIEAEKQNVDLAQEVYKVTQLEFQEGVGTTTDVVQAETSLRQAQNTYITTLLDLYTARLDLERAKGTLITYLNSK